MKKGSKAQALDLDEFLPYLIARITPLIDIACHPYFAPFEVTREIFRVLMVLHGKGPSNLTSLAQATSANISTLSRLIGRMEKRKLVRRRRLPRSREVVIEILPLGRRKCEALIGPSLDFERRITQRFDFQQLESLKRMLRRVYDAYCEQIVALDGMNHSAVRVVRWAKQPIRASGA